jgi:Fe2+ or Zn2+ uptake regulation protein
MACWCSRYHHHHHHHHQITRSSHSINAIGAAGIKSFQRHAAVAVHLVLVILAGQCRRVAFMNV